MTCDAHDEPHPCWMCIDQNIGSRLLRFLEKSEVDWRGRPYDASTREPPPRTFDRNRGPGDSVRAFDRGLEGEDTRPAPDGMEEE